MRRKATLKIILHALKPASHQPHTMEIVWKHDNTRFDMNDIYVLFHGCIVQSNDNTID